MSVMRDGIMRGGIMRGGIMRSQWGVWTPDQLFASGDEGFYADPIAGLYVFSDTAGTTHAPLAGTVARLDAPPGSPVAASFTNATVSQQPVRRADGLEFDGVDDRLSYPDDPALRFGASDFTVAVSGLTESTVGFGTFLDKRGIASVPGWNIGVERTTKQLRVYLRDSTQAVQWYLQPPGGWITGQWIDAIVEIDRTAAKARGYINGVYQSANDAALGTLGDISYTANIAIGSFSNGAFFWDGTIGRTFAINRLLTPAERAKLNAWLKEPHA